MKVGVHFLYGPSVWLVQAVPGLRSALVGIPHPASVGGQLKSDPILV